MSSHVGRQVDSIVERKLLEDPAGRLKKHIDAVVERHLLSSTLRVPDCASDIEVCVNLARKTISCSITVKAPGDRKSTKARLSWLLRMLPSDHEHVLIRAHWPGRAAPTMKGIVQLREEPELLQAENNGLVPHSFEILMVEATGKRFGGRKTFIEDVERIVPAFYDLVGANLTGC